MECGKCRYEIQKGWNFCPNCGNRQGIMLQLNNFIKRVAQAHPGAKVKVRLVKRPKPIQINPKLEVVEPKTKKLKNKIIIDLPGVESINQIHLRRAGQSLELNAQTQNKRYFKIINLENSRISNQMFAHEKLILKLT